MNMRLAEKHQTGLKRALGPILLLVITSCFHWRLIATYQYTWLDSPDLAFQVLPWWNYQAREWHAGRFPLWEPHQWSGQPLLGQVQPGAAYPLNWLLFMTPLRDGKLQMGYLHWYFILYHWLAAFNCYLFCRYIGSSRAAAVFGGCLFAFGAAVGNIDWPQMVNGTIWMPLVFLCLLKVRDQPDRANRHAAWAGLWLGVSWLAGHHQIPTFLTYGSLASWAWISFAGGRNWRTFLRPFLLFIAVTGLISALQTVPAAEYGQLAKRWVGMDEAIDWKTKVSYHVHEKYSLFPLSLLGVVIPGLDQSFSPFVGVVGATMASLALAFGWRRDEKIRWLMGLGLLGLLIALGGNSLLHGVLYAWAPLVDKARSPGMAIALFGFSIAALAAIGIDRLRPGDPIAAPYGRALLGLSGFLAAVYYATAMFRGQDSMPEQRAMVTAFVALLLAGLFTWYRSSDLRTHHFVAAALGLSLLELANVSVSGLRNNNLPWPQRTLPQTQYHNDVAAHLRQLTAPVRVEVDNKIVEYNFGDWHGISQKGGYLASLSANLTAIDMGSEAVEEIFAVTHSLGKTSRNPSEVLEYRGLAGVNLYRRAGEHPRVWTVHTILPVERGELKAAIQKLGPDQVHQAVVLVGRAPPLPFPDPSCGPDRARIRNYEPSRVVVGVRMGCAGVLILGDTNFPGWEAKLDGQPAEILAAYGVVRGVVVPAGEHQVEFRYRPRSVLFGAAMSAAGLMLVLAVTYGTRRRT